MSSVDSQPLVITDANERTPKVHWDEAVSGAAFAGAIDWDGLWADRSKAQPGEYLAWVKAADVAGNESFAVGKVRVEGKNALTITLPSAWPTATAIVIPSLPPSTLNPQLPTFNFPPSGNQTIPPQLASQTTRFHAANNPLPKSPTNVPLSTVMWGGAAAGAAGAFLAESLRRKKEREKRLQDYQNRPKVESEGKGGRLTGKQIAQAYQAAKNNFKAKLAQAQALGMSQAEAERLLKQVNATGKIGASLGAANEYIVQKIKPHFRKPSDDQPPPDAVIIPPLTVEQSTAVKNWNVAAQIVTWATTIGLTAGIGGAIGSRGGIVGAFAGAVIGAVAGATWGAYETICIASVQDEFDEAYQQGSGVTVWRDGLKFNVDANSSDGSYTQANGPLSALYAAATTLILTGKIP